MIELERLPEDNFIDRTTGVAPSVEGAGNIQGFGDAFTTAIQTTFPFVQEFKNPIESVAFTASDEEVETFYKEEFPNLTQVEQDSIQGNGGYRNRQQVDAILARIKDEQQMERDLYEYGGFAGSLSLKAGASFLNPADWFIALSTFGVGKALTSMKTINKVMNNYKKTSAIALGATEGAVAGYASEAFRQETQDIVDEDARFNTLLFGSVLGGSLGAKGWFDFVSDMNPQQQQRLFTAMEEDDRAFAAEVQSSYRSVGSAGVYDVGPSIDVDDLNAPTPGVKLFNKFSPRQALYNLGLPSVYKIVSKLAPSVDALKKDGQFVTQSQDTAFKFKNQLEGTRGELSNKIADINVRLNENRVSQGMPKLSEEEFGLELNRARMEATLQVRNHQAEIDVLESLKERTPEQTAELARLKSTEPEIQYSSSFYREINEAYDNYYMKFEDELRRPGIERRKAELEELETLTEKQALELKELSNWQPKEYKGYLTRIYNKDAIKNDLDTVRMIERALQTSPTARAMTKYATREDLQKFMDEQKEIAKSMAKKIREAKDLNSLRDILPQPSASSSQGIVSGGFTTSRKIDVNESELGDLIQKNMFEVTDFYHQDMSGKLSIRKAFQDDDIDTWEDFRDKYASDLSEEFNVAGMDQAAKDKALEDLEVVFKDLRGTDQIAKNPNNFWQRLKRGLMTFNNIRFSPNFGLVSLNELGPTIQMGGVQTMSFMMPSIKAAINKINSKEAGVEFINELQAMGIGIDLQHSKVIERYTEGQHFFETNSMLNVLRKAENKVFRWSGLPVVTDMYKSMLSAGFTMRLVNIGKRYANGSRLSYREEAMLSRIGLDKEDLVRFSQQPIQYDEQGMLKSFNLKDWDEDLSDKMGDILHRVTKGNILEPSSMDLPRLMTDPDKPLNHLLTQYYRFPVAAQTSLMSKAVNDRDIGALLGSMVAGLVSTSVELSKVYVGVKLAELAGIEVDNPYDNLLEDKEQQIALAGKMASINPMLGVLPMGVNVGAAFAGYPIPGTNFTPSNVSQTVAGPTFANLESLALATKDLVQNPGEVTDNQTRFLYQQLPRVPFLYDLSKHYLKD